MDLSKPEAPHQVFNLEKNSETVKLTQPVCLARLAACAVGFVGDGALSPPPADSHPSFPLLTHAERMNIQTTDRRQVDKKGELRDTAITAFLDFSTNRVSLKDSERLLQIKTGFPLNFYKWFA
ncbi:hypothetical protein [Pseudomonas sp. BE134]|uniref:hypothetical protein n=1 Tax=Pseudomonas sp. BE134 TaxID=2817843 RepID=UPI002857E7DF|nr:hypothetical protein [Pseudomonas sp. BE134]MDR6924366.1 hypothetical protein [Pseudomonas sp. BE134]